MPEVSNSDIDPEARASPRTPPRILVVDDDVTLLRLMSETLKAAGFSVMDAKNGAEAVEKCREFRPNLVLLDIEMPEMDGFSACVQMRRDADEKALPIVMVTGLDDAASIHRAFEAGATDFILKPINWPLFQYRVSAILAAAHISAELASSTEKIHSLERVTPDIALVVGRDGVILDQLGVSFSGKHGQQTLEDLWPREIAAIMRQRVKRVLKTRKNTSCEFELWGESGSRYYEARFLVDGRRRVLVVVQEVTARTSDTELYQLAYYDDSTRLPNRHLFEKNAASYLADAKLRERRLGVLCIEFDKLDPVSRLSRVEREAVLEDAANRLVRAIGEQEIDPHPRDGKRASAVARLSATQFGVLLTEVSSRDDAAEVAAKIWEVFEEETEPEAHPAQLKPIIGISLYPEDGEEVSTLVTAAEAAMQEARVAEDAGACFYSDSAEGGRDRFDLTEELQWAIAQQQLQLHYQPRAVIDSGDIVGVEALLRWHHPLRGFVSLEELMPLAEASGLIKSIGEWVLFTACTAAWQWNKRTRTPLRVSVNLSHQEFFRPDLIEKIDDILRRTRLDPGLLQLELTERTLMRAEDPVSSLNALHELGVGFILDDFGTGYSSLSYLKEFPMQALKIDRTFVRGLPDSRKDAAVCEVIIETAHKFGLKAVAEGVENVEQADFLQRHRCDEMQGYLLSEPLPLDDLQSFLSQRDYTELEA